jgi:hypothetical protein
MGQVLPDERCERCRCREGFAVDSIGFSGEFLEARGPDQEIKPSRTITLCEVLCQADEFLSVHDSFSLIAPAVSG